jgi:hypothetical protein
VGCSLPHSLAGVLGANIMHDFFATYYFMSSFAFAAAVVGFGKKKGPNSQ